MSVIAMKDFILTALELKVHKAHTVWKVSE